MFVLSERHFDPCVRREPYTWLLFRRDSVTVGAVGRSLNGTNEASGEMYIHLQTCGEEGREEGETWGGEEKMQGFRKTGKTFLPQWGLGICLTTFIAGFELRT